MKHSLSLLTALLLAPLSALHAADTPKPKPNILVILADDLGYADIPAHGGQGLSMPHLDALTRQGVRFSNGYVTSPQCSPSRCGLLTGIYNQRFGHEHNGCQHAAFNAGAKTLAEHLKPSGYATAAFGKWHLGDNGRGGITDTHHPTKHGFDESWGFSEYTVAAKTDAQGFPVPLRPPAAFHAQNFATRAADFIEAHSAQPWFIYLAMHEPHVKVIPTPESDSLTKTAAPGDPLRQKCLGALHDLDAGIGIVLAKLRALKLEERTLIVFLSDNGAPIDPVEVAQQARGETEVPKADPNAKTITKAKSDDDAVNGSRNEPLRGRKGLTWEGGIRIPFVMAWKGMLPAGQTFDQPVISLDIAPTALAAADTAALPGTKLDGVNLLPFLKGENKSAPHERLFWRYADRNLFAVREGNWKLVQSHTDNAQLYDLDADIGERNNLAAQHPDVVKRLQTAWDEWNATLKPPALDKASAIAPRASTAALPAAQLKFAAVFTDHAVLQREVAVPVWGWADAGAEVMVEFAGQTKTATAGATGKWFVKLDPLEASAAPRTLKVTAVASKASVELQDILVGEVWLGSGQSNMVMPVKVAQDFGREKAAANLPLLRMFKEESGPAVLPQADGKGEWKVCSADTVGDFSATLFFFGREIHKSLSIPVGLIHSAVGATSIEQWTAVEAQKAVKELAPIVAEAKNEPSEKKAVPSDPAGKKKPSEVEMQRYAQQLAKWEKAAKQARAENKPLPRKPRDPAVLQAQRGDIGELFNGKIAPLIPYAIKGAIWYQGEGNAGKEHSPLYQCQLSTLIRDWRARWGYEFPFGWAQLANYSRKARDWPVLREAQLKTLALPKTGMGINIDIGEENNIHPKNKQEVGRRLSLWALGEVYGGKVPATSGPLPAGHKINGHEVELSFFHTDGGLVAKGGELKGFVIAGADKQWKPATARIAGDKIIVTSAEVKTPVAIRYAWENWPTCNLYNGAGLPASPFRTDDWP